MSRRLHVILFAALSSLAASAAEPNEKAPPKPAIEAGPAVGWSFPMFSDKEGYRLYTLRGTEARFPSMNQIDVTGFQAVVFSGTAAEQVEKVLISPEASFFPKENRVTGPSAVRLIHDDIEVTGRGWTYDWTDPTKKKVTISHDARVTFRTQLNDILK